MRRAVLLLTVMGAALLLGSGVALAAVVQCVPGATSCFGTDQSDLIIGTHAPGGNDDIIAFGGDDEIRAFGGDDTVIGGNGNDEVHGSFGDDVLGGDGGGLPGNDWIHGSSGDDFIAGGDGSDTLLGSSDDDLINAVDILVGTDTVIGGKGDDEIRAAEGLSPMGASRDNIDCGEGFDEVTLDIARDVFVNCEVVHPV